MDRASGRDPPLKLRERAYDAFTRHLLERELAPGQFVSQRELVELSGLTLGAIRELIPRLESEGLIRTVPKRGMQIAQVDLALIRDAFQFRLILEKEAAALFAQNASDAEVKRLRDQHEEVLRRARKGVTPELIRQAQATDWDLHYTLIDAMGNQIISRAYRVNMLKIRLIRQQRTRLDNALVVPVMTEHLAIIEALESRNPSRASAAIAKHINDARARALQV
jgi:DNA-binding GntR family transcriptional regulator